MSQAYADTDFDVVDYQLFCLDPKVLHRHSGKSLMVRGPKPNNLDKNSYFVCLGAAQTFGRFCETPYPTLLQERLGIYALNLGVAGAGPSFFSKENEELLKYINNAKFAVVQVMSGRSESNSLYASKGIGALTRVSDGARITNAADAYKELLKNHDKTFIKKIIAETRENYCNNYKALLQAIEIPKILFWFSTRKPRYQEQYDNIFKLFSQFPHLINQKTIHKIKKYSDEYVECISQRGKPHQLINRFTGQPIQVVDQWHGGYWKENSYYPSPEMHVDAADNLEKICRKYLNSTSQPRKLTLFSFLNRKNK